MTEHDSIVDNICAKENTEIIYGEQLKKHTTFSIGGKCHAFININSESVLRNLVVYFNSNDLNYVVIGRGSNILVSDKGYDGYVLCLGKQFSEIKKIGANSFSANSGATLRAIGNYALANELAGFECLYGIPGSVGGAVYMNAGAYGGEIKDVVKKVTSIDRNGVIKEYTPDKLDFSYRHSVFCTNKEIILNVEFLLEKGVSEQIKDKMNELTQKRKSKQPLEYPSAGSTFKRPEGSYASLLIEQCGLKGLSVGGAEVSKKHSGFIINKDNATSSDVIELCNKVIETVQLKTGYKLELEPILLGTF